MTELAAVIGLSFVLPALYLAWFIPFEGIVKRIPPTPDWAMLEALKEVDQIGFNAPPVSPRP